MSINTASSPWARARSRAGEWFRIRASELFGYDAFISYARKDGQEYAGELFVRLEAAGFTICFDASEFAAGDQLPDSLAEVQRSHLLILLDTPAAQQSRWVAEEVSHAVARRLPIVRIPLGTPTDIERPSDEVARAAGAWGTLSDSEFSYLRGAIRCFDPQPGVPSTVAAAVLPDLSRSLRTRTSRRRLRRWSNAAVVLGLVAAAYGAFLLADRRAIERRDAVVKLATENAPEARQRAIEFLQTPWAAIAQRSNPEQFDDAIRAILDATTVTQWPDPGRPRDLARADGPIASNDGRLSVQECEPVAAGRSAGEPIGLDWACLKVMSKGIENVDAAGGWGQELFRWAPPAELGKIVRAWVSSSGQTLAVALGNPRAPGILCVAASSAEPVPLRDCREDVQALTDVAFFSSRSVGASEEYVVTLGRSLLQVWRLLCGFGDPRAEVLSRAVRAEKLAVLPGSGAIAAWRGNQVTIFDAPTLTKLGHANGRPESGGQAERQGARLDRDSVLGLVYHTAGAPDDADVTTCAEAGRSVVLATGVLRAATDKCRTLIFGPDPDESVTPDALQRPAVVEVWREEARAGWTTFRRAYRRSVFDNVSRLGLWGSGDQEWLRIETTADASVNPDVGAPSVSYEIPLSRRAVVEHLSRHAASWSTSYRRTGVAVGVVARPFDAR